MKRILELERPDADCTPVGVVYAFLTASGQPMVQFMRQPNIDPKGFVCLLREAIKQEAELLLKGEEEGVTFH